MCGYNRATLKGMREETSIKQQCLVMPVLSFLPRTALESSHEGVGLRLRLGQELELVRDIKNTELEEYGPGSA